MNVPDVPDRRRRGVALLRAYAAEPRTPTLHFTVLSSFNLELLPPFLAEALDRRGLPAAVETGAFGQIAQALVTHERADAGDVLVVPAAEDLLAGLFDAEVPPDDAGALADARLAELAGAITTALERCRRTTVYVVVFPVVRLPNGYVLDPRDARRGQQALQTFLDGVRDLGRLSPRVVVVDWDWEARAGGTAALTDERLWYLARMRLGPRGLAALADTVARHVAASRGLARKVAVVDLDGTLWGGVLGEVGVHGIGIGEERIGLAYRDVQRELLRLRANGVVLAIASKNDRHLVVDAFARHAEMPLSLADFAAERINWADKATNLREIADELNLGLDSFVFLDDNPVEREWVRRALPQVSVPELPTDPAERPAFLRSLGAFERITVTDADADRAVSYAAEAKRRALRSEGLTFEGFLRSLEQEVTIEPIDESTLQRAAQLCQRTNQFNLTNRRYTVAELEAMAASRAHELYTVAVRDRFANSGIIGFAALVLRDGEAEIDSLLLSCRVLGRRVEDALLAVLARRASEHGAATLVGVRVGTARNGLTERFYSDRGFAPAGDGSWRLQLGEHEIPMPEEMTIKVRVHATASS